MDNYTIRSKRSAIWKITTEEFASIVRESSTLSDIARTCGLEPKGSNLLTIKRRLWHEKVNFSHIKTGLASNTGRKFRPNRLPAEQVLVKNSSHSRSCAKRLVLSQNLIPNKCFKCGLDSEWNGETLVLRLDHANGISNDHRVENLRMVCPNCDSQLPTYCGRRKKYQVILGDGGTAKHAGL